MTKRSILVAVAFAMLVTGTFNSSSFARDAAAGPGGPGAAGPGSSGGGAGSGSGGGGGAGTGGNGAHVVDLIVVIPRLPPRVPKKPYHPPVFAQTVPRDARCALGPMELGYYRPERLMLTQICANQL
jgi:hypothetical protein